MKNDVKLVILIVVAMVFLVGIALYVKKAEASGFVISWLPPAAYEDGSVLQAEDIVKYQIYVYEPGSKRPKRAGSESRGRNSWKYRRSDMYPGLWCFHVVTELAGKVRSRPSEKQCLDYL